MKDKIALLSCLAVIFFGLTGCAPTTKLTRVWMDESLHGKKIEKVFVIGILQNQSRRELFENELVKGLNARGIDAVPSYTVLPFEQTTDKEKIRSAVELYNRDAILTTRLVDTKIVQRTTVAEGNVCDRYVSQTCMGYEPVIPIIQDTFSIMETNLSDARTEKVMWSAQSEMWMVEKDDALIRSFVRVMIVRLSQDKMIQGSKP